MSALFLPVWYFKWHYSRAFSDLIRLWVNCVWFVWNFFSVPYLLRTLFAPWQGIREETTRRGNAEDVAANFVTNLIMRFIGALFRLAMILFGSVLWCATVLSLPLLLVAWALAPFLLVSLIIISLKL